MASTPYSELLLWEEWWAQELNNPDRHDVYLMQVAHAVRVSGGDKDCSLADCLITFKRSQDRPRYKTREEAAAASKARWQSMLPPKKP